MLLHVGRSVALRDLKYVAFSCYSAHRRADVNQKKRNSSTEGSLPASRGRYLLNVCGARSTIGREFGVSRSFVKARFRARYPIWFLDKALPRPPPQSGSLSPHARVLVGGGVCTAVGGLKKRSFDLVCASLALLALAPLMIVVAFLIALLLGRPIIYRQKRIGFGGIPFTCYKFRTMGVNADEILRRHLADNPEAAHEWKETRKLRDDPRVNCLGRILRRSSLDELPQLLNVLRGDMSLVGPRPVVPEELAYYGPHARECLQARPGVTGLWQTSGRNRVSYSSRVVRDRYYVRNWSLLLDFFIVLKTLPAVMDFNKTN